MDQEERNTNNEEYNEIDLMDYVKVILKRQRLILAVFLISVIAAAAVSLYLPKVYKINTSLEMGKIAEVVIENPEQVVEKIKGDVYGIVIRKQLEISEEKYPKVKVDNPKGTNLITVEIESDRTDMSKSILEAMNKLILTEHQGIIIVKQEFLRKDIELSEENMKISQKDIERVQAKIFSLKKEQRILENKVRTLQETLVYEQTPGTQFALFDTQEKLEAKVQEIENRYLQINSLEAAINSFKNRINALEGQIEDIKPTQILKTTNVSENPIGPRLLLNIALAGILAIFMGVFLALFKEWWIKNK